MSEGFVAGDLTIEVDESAPGLIRLDWRGSSNVRGSDPVLAEFLSGWVDRALQGDARLELHFEELRHFNSTTIAVLVELLKRLRTARVEVALSFRGSLRWQRLSFEALRVFEVPGGQLRIEAV